MPYTIEYPPGYWADIPELEAIAQEPKYGQFIYGVPDLDLSALGPEPNFHLEKTKWRSWMKRKMELTAAHEKTKQIAESNLVNWRLAKEKISERGVGPTTNYWSMRHVFPYVSGLFRTVNQTKADRAIREMSEGIEVQPRDMEALHEELAWVKAHEDPSMLMSMGEMTAGLVPMITEWMFAGAGATASMRGIETTFNALKGGRALQAAARSMPAKWLPAPQVLRLGRWSSIAATEAPATWGTTEAAAAVVDTAGKKALIESIKKSPWVAAKLLAGLTTHMAMRPHDILETAVNQATSQWNLNAAEQEDFANLILEKGVSWPKAWGSALLAQSITTPIEFGTYGLIRLAESTGIAAKSRVLQYLLEKSKGNVGSLRAELLRFGISGGAGEVGEERAQELAHAVIPGMPRDQTGVLGMFREGQYNAAIKQMASEFLVFKALNWITNGRSRIQMFKYNKFMEALEHANAQAGIQFTTDVGRAQGAIQSHYATLIEDGIKQEEQAIFNPPITTVDRIEHAMTTGETLPANPPITIPPSDATATFDTTQRLMPRQPLPPTTEAEAGLTAPTWEEVEAAQQAGQPVPARRRAKRAPKKPARRGKKAPPAGEAMTVVDPETTNVDGFSSFDPNTGALNAYDGDTQIFVTPEPMALDTDEDNARFDQASTFDTRGKRPVGRWSPPNYSEAPADLPTGQAAIPQQFGMPTSVHRLAPRLIYEIAEKLGAKFGTLKPGLSRIGQTSIWTGHPDRVLMSIATDQGNAKNLAAVLAHELGHLDHFMATHLFEPEIKNVLQLITGSRNTINAFMTHHLARSYKGGPLAPPSEAELASWSYWNLRNAGAEEEYDAHIQQAIPLTNQAIRVLIAQLRGSKIISQDNLDWLRTQPVSVQRDVLGLAADVGAANRLLGEPADAFVNEIYRGNPVPPDTYHQQVERTLNNRRFLINESWLLPELLNWTQYWRPWDPAKASRKTNRYRVSPAELYADAVSGILVAPAEFKQRCPRFWRAYFGWLEQHPQMLREYGSLQALLHGKPEELWEHYDQRAQAMYKKAEDRFLAFHQSQIEQNRWTWPNFIGTLANWTVDTMSANLALNKKQLNEARREYRKELMDKFKISRSEAHKMAYDFLPPDAPGDLHEAATDFWMRDNEMHIAYNRLDREILDPLLVVGYDKMDVGRYLEALRYISELKDTLAPLGSTYEDYMTDLYYLAQKQGIGTISYKNFKQIMEAAPVEDRVRNRIWGNSPFGSLEGMMVKWHEEIIWPFIEAAHDAGLMGKDLWETCQNNKYTYATRWVSDYIEKDGGKVLGQWMKVTGTLKEAANPLEATMLAMNNIHMATVLNNLKQHMLVNWRWAKIGNDVPLNRRTKEPEKGYQPAPKNGLMYYVQDGKRRAYEAPAIYTNMFIHPKYGAFKGMKTIGRFMKSTFGQTWHRFWITLNPEFAFRNVFRDMSRTWQTENAILARRREKLRLELIHQHNYTPEEAKKRANEEIGTLSVKDIVEAWFRALPDAHRYAMGEHVADIQEMIKDKAFMRPYTDVTTVFRDPDADMLEALMARHGVKVLGPAMSLFDQAAQNWTTIERMRPAVEKISPYFTTDPQEWKDKPLTARMSSLPFTTFRHMSTLSEVAGKLGMWRELKRRPGISTKERTQDVLWNLSTPAYHTEGDLHIFLNSIFPYWRVRMNALRAFWDIMSEPVSRENWLMRTMPFVMMKTFWRAAKAGWLGGLLEWYGERMPKYWDRYYIVLPCGWTRDTMGVAIPTYFRIPVDEHCKTVGNFTDLLLDPIFEGRAKEPILESIKEILGDVVGSQTPFIEIPHAIDDYRRGVLHYDRFRDAPIMDQREFEAGGWYGVRGLGSWIFDKTGIVSVLSTPIIDTFSPPSDLRNFSAWQKIEHYVPVFRSFFKSTDAGLQEEQYEYKMDQRREEARFALEHIPPEAYRLIREMGGLDTLVKRKVSEKGHVDEKTYQSLKLLNNWYRNVYVRARQNIKLAVSQGLEAEAAEMEEALRQSCLDIADELRRQERID